MSASRQVFLVSLSLGRKSFTIPIEGEGLFAVWT